MEVRAAEGDINMSTSIFLTIFIVGLLKNGHRLFFLCMTNSHITANFFATSDKNFA
jgi:hypothetical protein